MLFSKNRQRGEPVPIATVVASLYAHFGLPLPAGWVECNGQVLNDPASPLHGMTIPNMNGEGATFIGSTGTGGSFVGANSYNIAISNLPTDSLTTGSAGGHTHEHDKATANFASVQLLPLGAAMVQTLSQTPTHGSNTGAHTHAFKINSGPSQDAIDNRQRSLVGRWIIRVK
jgi:hypothetical protein